MLAPPSARPPAGPPARAFLALLPESDCVFESVRELPSLLASQSYE